MTGTGLYIHIPFCAAKCEYCDFFSFAQTEPNPGVWAVYKDALVAELRAVRADAGIQAVDTVYIGGGTPTVWPAPFLAELLRELQQFPLVPGAEITAEANPGTLSAEKLAALAGGGVNRLSIGLQAWQDSLLQRIGRIHTQDAFAANYQAARDAGFQNISVDIMFSLPGQTLSDWEETLMALTALAPEHISSYSLTPEEETPLWTQLENGHISLPDDETDRVMYARCKAFLQEKGYRQYELSNFAKPGFESRHNLRYWTRKPYLGIGLGAHSFYNGERWHNTTDLHGYIAAAGKAEIREDIATVTRSDAMSEMMFLGLRLNEGVAEADFENRFGVTLMSVYGEWLVKMEGERLLRTAGGRWRLTDLGMDLANRVFMGFV